MLIRKFISQALILLADLLPKVRWRMLILSAFINGDNESKEFLQRIKREAPWYKKNGDSNFLLNFDLNENSIIFDIGGCIGDFAAAIFCRSGGVLHIFEPVKNYVAILQKRFGRNPKIFIHDYAVGAKTEELEIFYAHGGTSFFFK